MSADQSDHAEVFGAAARRFVAAAEQFTAQVAPRLSPIDCGKLYLIAAVGLLCRAAGDAGTAAMLRELADGIDAGRPARN